MSISGDAQYIGRYHDACGRYYDLCGGISSVHRGFQYKSKAFINLLSHMSHGIPPIY